MTPAPSDWQRVREIFETALPLEPHQRRAYLLSALNHPHICTLFDIGRVDDLDFLVMEYVDGATLTGPVARADALPLAPPIASALVTAHRHGILHRDIKPGNVMRTLTGVKLLDFGLARSIGAGSDVTLTSEGTYRSRPKGRIFGHT